MTDQFIAEIRLFAGNFAPTGWALCNGQLMPISQNTALFSLLGTSYGGDGRTTFGLPNLMGAAPLQQGQGAGLSQRFLGETGGSPTVTLLASEMPVHTHVPNGSTGLGDSASPGGHVWAEAGVGRQADQVYSTGTTGTAMHPLTTQMSGAGLPHNNMPPFLCVSYIIALQGIFPSRP